MSSPTPPPSHLRDYSTDYYYFVVAVAVIALLLLVSNMVVSGCCALVLAVKRFLCSRGLLSGTDEDDDHISRLIPACKYKKEQAAAAADSECSVCLMPFVDGENVRKLPECKHSFHTPCIDMWLYSHSNCPMCRADVLPEGRRQDVRRCPTAAAAREETSQSRRSLIEPGGMAGVVAIMM